MKITNRLITIGFFVIVFAIISNQTEVRFQQIPAPLAEKLPIHKRSAKLVSPPKHKVKSIIDVDFKNFTYPWTSDQGAPGTFTLKNGEKKRVSDEDTQASLQKIEFGDVTSDGKKEAMISIYPWSGGNCQCYMVYVYTLKNDKPLLLWSFDTWDKAEGGFKRAYAKSGDLIVELFGDDTFVGGEWQFDIAEGKFNGLCCPTTITRIHFHWDGKKFIPTGKREVFDYDWRKQRNGRN